MAEQKLIFLDIDGTLTIPGKSEPPESALAAIRAAQARGHRVFLCTGRNPGMTAPVLRYGFDGAVCCAGGHITVGSQVIFDHPLSLSERDELLSLLRKSGAFIVLEARDAAYADGSFEEFLSQGERGNSELERWRAALEDDLGVRPMAEYRGEPVYKAVFASFDVHQLDGVRAKLEDRFAFCLHAFFSGMVNGELIPRAFDKGQAIRRVCERMGVPVEDTVGFGDSMNDWEMILAAGTGVAMGNGSAELRRRADLVCPPVEEDGLAAAFRELRLA